jgi:hypothetical protein
MEIAENLREPEEQPKFEVVVQKQAAFIRPWMPRVTRDGSDASRLLLSLSVSRPFHTTAHRALSPCLEVNTL